MNRKQMTGKVKGGTGELTNSDLWTIAGKRDQLVGVTRKRQVYLERHADSELNEFVNEVHS